jgi:hypothetical protein
MCDQEFDDFDFGQVEEEKGVCEQTDMCDQEFDDFDFDEVEEEKGVCEQTSRKDYFREYHKRPEVIEKERLRRLRSKQTKTLLTATFDEVSYAASLIL